MLLEHNILDLLEQNSVSDSEIVIRTDRFKRPLITFSVITAPTTAKQFLYANISYQILNGSGDLLQSLGFVDVTSASPFVLQGDLSKDSEKLHLKPGDFLTIPALKPHQFLPDKNIRLRLLVTYEYFRDYLDTEQFDESLLEKIKKVKGIIMDVDGTMTDGKVLVNEQGEEFASFSRVDSLALLPWQGMARSAGVISRETTSIAGARADKLKIDCIQGVKDKVEAAEKMIGGWGLSWEQICYVGDDVNDLPLLEAVGLSACPKDAQPQVLQAVDLVIPRIRGDHVIRELLDLIFLVQLGKLPEVYERSWGEEYLRSKK